jgi:hypothetical protein
MAYAVQVRETLMPRSWNGLTLASPPNVAIRTIRPTQITVGYREVAEKRRRWRGACNTSKQRMLQRRVVPIVRGPGANCYAVDRHHWLCALSAEGISDVPVVAVADLRDLNQAMFWSELDRRGWCRPYDAQSRRQDCSEIPTSMAALKDDPFRSLASALRRAGGYAKDETLFSEFFWADYLRGCMQAEDVDGDFDAALQEALVLSRRVATLDLRFTVPLGPERACYRTPTSGARN